MIVDIDLKLNMYEYARGYFDGRSEGIYNNPYDDKEMHHRYKLGYDRGVADYCHYELGED